MVPLPVLLLAIVTSVMGPAKPLTPAWSPDHQILATTKVPQDFITPEGGNYSILLNGKLVYPIKVKRWFSKPYGNQHTLLSEFAWSPDSERVAFLEKVYDWQYSDPFDKYFDGWVSNERYYLAMVSRDGKTIGYELPSAPKSAELHWQNANTVALNGHEFNLQSEPAKLLP